LQPFDPATEQSGCVLPQRDLAELIGAGDEAVERHRDLQAELRHAAVLRLRVTCI
jgi:hypothetical protein